MPELPDVVLYIEHLKARVQGQPLGAARLHSPFVLRTVQPPLTTLVGRPVNIQATKDWIMFLRERLMGQPYLTLIGKLEGE